MAKQTGDAVMIKNGKEMLTMAVFAICITAPLGAILIATLGKSWLAYDAEFDTTSPHYKKSVEEGEVVDETVEAAAIEEDIEAAKPEDKAKVADEVKEVKDKDPAKSLKKCMKKFLKSKNIELEEV